MVKKRRRELAILAVLLAVGAWLWLRTARPSSSAGAPLGGDGKAEEPLSIDEVPRIGLDRLAELQAGNEQGADDDDLSPSADGGFRGGAGGPGAGTPVVESTTPIPTPPPTPTEPVLPAMNVRYIGAVEVRSGVWVASLLNDHKDLLTGKEGDIIGNRYRIVKIGIESIDLMETASGRQRRVRLGGS